MNPFHRLHALRLDNDAAGYRMAEAAPRFAALKEGKRAVVAHQLFQTPVLLAAHLVAAAGVVPGSRVLEPSAGLGRLLDALPACSVVAVEIAPACAGELFRQERQGVRLLQRDFLTVEPEETGLFDFVVMNPPFTMRADIRHCAHALRFLKPGGTLAALCLDTDHRERAFRDRAATWEKIPAGAFKAEGTGVATVMFTIIK